MSDQDSGFQVPRGQMPGAQPGQQSIPGAGGAEIPNVKPPEGAEEQPVEGPAAPSTEMPGVTPTEQPAEQPLKHNDEIGVPKAPENPFQTPKAQPPQHEQLHLFDVTAPPGMQPMPSAPAVSIPGGRPPTPGNPIQFPGTFSHFIPMMVVHSSEFIYANDALSEYFETMKMARQPIYVQILQHVTMELSGGKIPLPGAESYGTSKEGVPLYRVMDLGYNPDTGMRENADVNVLQGAPEWQGQWIDVKPGSRGEVLDYEPALKMAYVLVPLNYPEGGDVRLHPHSIKGWVDYKDLKPLPSAGTPWRKSK